MDGIEDRSRSGAAASDGVESNGMDRAFVRAQEGATLLSLRRFAEAEPVLREAIELNPNSSTLLNKLGAAIWEQGRPKEAEPLFERAIELNPDDPVIWNNLGLTRWDLGRAAEAAECYRRSLEWNPLANDVVMNLGVVLSDLGRFDEALVYLREAVSNDPQSPDTIQNLGMTLGRLGRWHEAVEHYERALRLRPDYAEVHRNRAYGWLYLGNYERGWPEHEWRLRCRRHVGFKPEIPAWQGEPLNGRMILLHAEQGLGDTLQFIRYAGLVAAMGGRVCVIVQTPLIRIVARCPGVEVAVDGTSGTPICDVHASLMSLPAIFRTTQRTVPNRVPYLPAEPIVVDRWRQALGEALGESAPRSADRPLLVGIAWQGSPNNPMDRFRSFPLAELAPVADVPGVRFLCIQTIDGLDQIPALEGRFPVVDVPSNRPRDFRDSAALISLCDLIITPDTAVAHLAGGLGKPVWLALSTVGEWRWMLDREDSPWYPTMRIFRQERYGEWGPVFGRMAAVLRQAIAELNHRAA